MSYAPRLFAEEAEAKDAGITQPYLEGAMHSPTSGQAVAGRQVQGQGRRGRKVWRLRVVFDLTTSQNALSKRLVVVHTLPVPGLPRGEGAPLNGPLSPQEVPGLGLFDCWRVFSARSGHR